MSAKLFEQWLKEINVRLALLDYMWGEASDVVFCDGHAMHTGPLVLLKAASKDISDRLAAGDNDNGNMPSVQEIVNLYAIIANAQPFRPYAF